MFGCLIMLLWYLILLAITLLAALILIPLVVTVYALRWTWRGGKSYLTSFAQVMGIPGADTAIEPPRPPRQRTDNGHEPAYEHYLFGQVKRDFITALSRTWAQARREFAADGRRISQSWLRGAWTEDFTPHLFGVLLLIGLGAGALVGGLLLGAVALVQCLLLLVCVGLGLSAIFVLRAADSALLRVRRIRMTCPECYRHVPYPSYRCPGCGTLHGDVRPGRYGVLRRRCACGEESLPTLLILGSHRLAAFCPHEGCGQPLSDTAGTAVEAMLALFGGSNVGKTRLLTTMVLALQAARGTTVEFADRLTARRLEELLSALRGNQLPPRTGPAKPRAYSLYIRRGDARRQLVHFFDPGGERFYDSERLAALEYFRSARTLIFVIDPFSIDGVWNALPPARREAFSPRADHSPWYVFQLLAKGAREMRADVKQVRLAVTVSKADVLAREKLSAPVPDSASVERWLAEMDQDHLVKSMRQTFGQVRFFHTSAVLRDGAVSPQVHDLVAWVLQAPPAGPANDTQVAQ